MCENCAIVFSGLLQALAVLVAAYVAAQAALAQLERQFKIRQYQLEQEKLERTADTLIALLVDVDGAIEGWTSQFGQKRVDFVKERIVSRNYKFYYPEGKMVFSSETLRDSFDSIPASCIEAVVNFYKQDEETVEKLRFFQTPAFANLDDDLKEATVDILVLEGVTCVQKSLRAREAITAALETTISRLKDLASNAPAGSFRLDGHKSLLDRTKANAECGKLLAWSDEKLAKLEPRQAEALDRGIADQAQATSEQDDRGSGTHVDGLQAAPEAARKDDSEQTEKIQ